MTGQRRGDRVGAAPFICLPSGALRGPCGSDAKAPTPKGQRLGRPPGPPGCQEVAAPKDCVDEKPKSQRGRWRPGHQP